MESKSPLNFYASESVEKKPVIELDSCWKNHFTQGATVKGSLNFGPEVRENLLGYSREALPNKNQVPPFGFHSNFMSLKNYHLIKEKVFHETFSIAVCFITVISTMLKSIC